MMGVLLYFCGGGFFMLFAVVFWACILYFVIGPRTVVYLLQIEQKDVTAERQVRVRHAYFTYNALIHESQLYINYLIDKCGFEQVDDSGDDKPSKHNGMFRIISFHHPSTGREVYLKTETVSRFREFFMDEESRRELSAGKSYKAYVIKKLRWQRAKIDYLDDYDNLYILYPHSDLTEEEFDAMKASVYITKTDAENAAKEKSHPQDQDLVWKPYPEDVPNAWYGMLKRNEKEFAVWMIIKRTVNF